MTRVSWLISKYLVKAVVPYFAFAWLLLSVILFLQQASRFSDIFFNVNIPAKLVWQLTIALIPNVIAFTCPMAMLVGVVIGLSKMQGDSELVVIRASGVGNLQITAPIAMLGILCSVFAFMVNLKGVPFAASLVRKVALETALQKLESPIEPGIFNTEIGGFTIYVRAGDADNGRWNDIFIYTDSAKTGVVRLITSKSGRIDASGDQSELVLENATSTMIPFEPGKGKYITENIGELRFSIQTRRAELIQKLNSSSGRLEELGLAELSDYATTTDGTDRIEAQLLWQRRIILSFSPLIFCLLGSAMILRFNRGGRGFGTLLALSALIGYFVLAFLGEQLARVGQVGVVAAGLIPLVGSLLAILWLNYSGRIEFGRGLFERIKSSISGFQSPTKRMQTRNILADLTTGLRDLDLVLDLAGYFLLTLTFLASIFVIFTAFELWKFAGTISGGFMMLVRYLFYLLPFVYLQIAPSAAMIAILATYVIKSRRNEIVTWTSAGQSIYRLLIPCFVLTIMLGVVDWQVQERILPKANQTQDAFRSLIMNRGVASAQPGKYWVSSGSHIYSFMPASDNEKGNAASTNGEGQSTKMIIASDNVRGFIGLNTKGNGMSPKAIKLTEFASDNEKGNVGSTNEDVASMADVPPFVNASDNEHRIDVPVATFFIPHPSTFILSALASDNEKPTAPCPPGCVMDISVYEFTKGKPGLQILYRAKSGSWQHGKVYLYGDTEKDDLREGKIETSTLNGAEIPEEIDPFGSIRKKPSHLNSFEIKQQIAASDSDTERRSFGVALEKKYASILLPLVIALFTAPFALSLSRKGKAETVGYAVGLWLLFAGVSGVFEQFGLSGSLTPQVAVWSPLVLFAMLGIYLLSKVRT